MAPKVPTKGKAHKTKESAAEVAPPKASTMPGKTNVTALSCITDELAESTIRREPLASMPIEELEALVEAVEPGSTVDRGTRALAFARRIVRQIEARNHPTAHPGEVMLAIEAAEKAWDHFRPPVRSFENHRGRSAFAERVIDQLEWGQRTVIQLMEREISAGKANDVSYPLALVRVATALHEMDPTIPIMRWTDALEAWRGEVPVRRVMGPVEEIFRRVMGPPLRSMKGPPAMEA